MIIYLEKCSYIQYLGMQDAILKCVFYNTHRVLGEPWGICMFLIFNFSEMNLYSPQIGCFFSIGERFKTGRLMNMLACWEKHQFDEQIPILKDTKHVCFTTHFLMYFFFISLTLKVPIAT